MFQLAFADGNEQRLSGQIDAMQENDISLLEIRNVDGTNVSDLSIAQAKEIQKEIGGCRKIRMVNWLSDRKIDITDAFAPHLDKFCHTLEGC